MMGVPIKNFLRKRKDRALATILNGVDELHLNEQQKRMMRTVVVDALNSYHDAVLDLMHSEDDQYTRNDVVLDALARMEALVHNAKRVS